MKKIVIIFMLVLAAAHVSCATKIYPECEQYIDDPVELEECQAETREYYYVKEVQKFHEMCDWCNNEQDTVIYMRNSIRSYRKGICEAERPDKWDMRNTHCVSKRALEEALRQL